MALWGMDKRRCHYAKIRYCLDLTSSTSESFPAFEVILWTHPEMLIEITKVDDFPELRDELTRKISDILVPSVLAFIETEVAKGTAPPLIMGRLGRLITGTFYVSKIGEEVRKTRDSAA